MLFLSENSICFWGLQILEKLIRLYFIIFQETSRNREPVDDDDTLDEAPRMPPSRRRLGVSAEVSSFSK